MTNIEMEDIEKLEILKWNFVENFKVDEKVIK